MVPSHGKIRAVVPQKETAMPYVDFKAIKAAVSIEDAANLLKLPLKKSGNQLRSNCPACGNEDERIVVITPSRGLFYCFDAKVGGDCLALVQHITGLDVQDAAQFLAPKEATVPQKQEVGDNRPNSKSEPKSRHTPGTPPREFDPAAFASKLAFTDEVAELGINEEDATRLQIGFTRGKVYFPVRNEDGSISGFVGYADGRLKMPPQWIGTNVVKLKRA
jgi:DNA primase